MPLPSVAEARAVMLGAVAPLGHEDVPLGAALGRVLAAPVTASRDQPPFPASAMDGWAVRAADVASAPVRLSVLGESAAGAGFAGPVTPGGAVRVFTGAPVPDGADRVVIQENARREGDAVIIESAEGPAHIRPAAGDFRAGSVLLTPPVRLDAAMLGVAASAGWASLRVARQPRVTLVTTGAELVPPGGAPRPDQIFESNLASLSALVTGWGGIATALPVAADDAEALAALIAPTLTGCDVLVVVGGASVGDYDLAKPALARLGLTLTVDRVALRPGKPTWFGALPDGTLVLGLPGNPASAQVCAHLFLEPLLAALQDMTTARPTLVGRAATPLPANGDREHWMRARIAVDADGMLTATPFRDQDSSLQTVLAAANGLICRPAHAPAAEAGAHVDLMLTGPLA